MAIMFVDLVDDESMSRHAADIIVAAVRRRPDLLLCAATGASPARTYERLAESARHEPSTFSRLRIIKLDEWAGLPPHDPGTCETYLRQHLVAPMAVGEERYISFRGDADDSHSECDRIRSLLESAGPIDVCVLGLGLNGHLGFNEPGDQLHPTTHVATLTRSSMDHPMVAHASGRVTHGLTLGMADILRSRAILLLVSGAHKREALTRLRSPMISTSFPASFLWLHPDVTCVHDRSSVG